MPDAIVTATPEEVGLSSAGLAAIDAYVQSQIDAGAIPGAVTLVARHGRICHVNAMGRKDIATGEASQVDGLYRIFSMTKPVTAVALMMLWDEGRWDFDDPIARHLPEFADLKVYAGRDAAGEMRLVDPDHPPTMHELVTHSAGFGYAIALVDPNDPIDLAFQAARVWEAKDLPDMMARIARCPLAYQPATAWRYSIGMDIEGAVIERLTGQSLDVFLAERLFAPLGMDDTRFFTPPDQAGRLAKLYLKLGGRPLAPIHNLLHPDCDAPPARALGGSGLVSTIGDYARFAQFLLDRGDAPGGRLLSEAAIAQMMRNHLPDALLEQGFAIGHQRIRPGIGMGVNGIVFTDPALADVPVGRGTYQWDGAAGTWFWIDPENDLLFVGLTQFFAQGGPPLQQTAQRLMRQALID